MNKKRIFSNLTLLSTTSFQIVGPVIYHPIAADIKIPEANAVFALFPKIKMQKFQMELSPDQIIYLEKSLGQKIKNKKITFYKSKNNKNWIYIDQVLGKHEYITYALALYNEPKKEAKVKGIEILEYKESYGYEIANPNWKKIFTNKDVNSELTLDKDIPNITGATLSCNHVTKGVKRLLYTHELIIKNKK